MRLWLLSMSATLDLCLSLIKQASISPDDKNCQQILIQRLQAMAFEIEEMHFGEVKNFWARHGSKSPVLSFAGHTDVVPTGPLGKWSSPPFRPTIRDGLLFGRGAADMKGSLAAMVTACERFLQNHPHHQGSLGFLITSDEEGVATHGTVKVMQVLKQRQEVIDFCVIGEPSSNMAVGDVCKNGRRGSLSGHLTVKGVQGHIAYPQLAINPIHLVLPALAELSQRHWDQGQDQGNDYFPPTSFQISNINSGTGVTNIIPSKIEVMFNFRFSTELNAEQIKAFTQEVLDKYQLKYHLAWTLSGNPFITPKGALIDAVISSIKCITNIDTELSTAGGTSDGRFIAPSGTQVVELGPRNESIHKIDEHVSVQDLDTLSDIYEEIMKKLLL